MKRKLILISVAILISIIISFLVTEAYLDENKNWWTNALCNEGEIKEGLLWDSCINESGTYIASFSGERCYDNRTSSCRPYWHLVQISEGERT